MSYFFCYEELHKKRDYSCIDFPQSFILENELKLPGNDYCFKEMSVKENNILKYNRGEESMSVPFVVYCCCSLFTQSSI